MTSQIPQEIIDEYYLHDLVDKDGWVYLKTVKIIYGLKQAGIIANMELTKHLDKFGYYPVQHTPGLWRHKMRAKISPSSSTTLQSNTQRIKTPTISYLFFVTPYEVAVLLGLAGDGVSDGVCLRDCDIICRIGVVC